MTSHHLNPWAILAAAVSAFVIGGLWYSPVTFGGLWKRVNRFGTDEPRGTAGKIFALSFALSLVMAINLAMFLSDGQATMVWGATAGFLAGFGWVTMGIGIVALFERRPWLYVMVNGGYLTVTLVVMGRLWAGGDRGLGPSHATTSIRDRQIATRKFRRFYRL
jgi:hypothetical protein